MKDLEAILNEDDPIRELLSNEECEPPSSDSTSAPSISVDTNADIGEKEEVRSLEASTIDGEFGEIYFLVARFLIQLTMFQDPNPCPLSTDIDRLRIEVVYARSETQTELMCRLCL